MSLQQPELNRDQSSAAAPSPSAEVVWTIVVAGGSGQRFGGPKQYEMLGSQRVLDWCVAAARAASAGVVVVVPEPDADREGGVAGGITRSDSVRAGLAHVPPEATVVCVHDGARPFADAALFERVVAAVAAGADGAIPGVPVTDTIKQVGADGTVVATPARADLMAVQTPQAFRAATLIAAHAEPGPLRDSATDDAALVEAAGGRVVVVAGDPRNRKITTPDDLQWARQTVGSDTVVSAEGATVSVPHIRVGQGFDIHRFSDDPARVLVLGGVVFEGARGLHGHSDADAVAHAATDALLGAAGLGDIGEHFPDTDPQWKGADSLQLLRRAAQLVREAGFEIGNVDCSVVCETPKLAPHKATMQRRLSDAAGAPVTVKGRRAEGLGALGRQEGIAVWANAVIIATGS
ncbi:MAG: 2-C-methyl-D-erythritol 4-phosphate cytidylyltransferase, partial [Actinomycetota bacterium]|nr:2-C-methyl-D-erythritol 4-phosphate cytidylyltransferase [Actinomycetota bacterium]